MESCKKNEILDNIDDFAHTNSPNKVRIIKVLSHYLNMKTHNDKDQLHSLLKNKLEKGECGSKEKSL